MNGHASSLHPPSSWLPGPEHESPTYWVFIFTTTWDDLTNRLKPSVTSHTAMLVETCAYSRKLNETAVCLAAGLLAV